MKQTALYLRTTLGPSVRDQRRELESVIMLRGWKLAAVYCDDLLQDDEGTEAAPELDDLRKAIRLGRFDCIAAWSVGFVVSSLHQLLDLLNELQSSRADIYAHREQLDTSIDSGANILRACNTFVELERAIIRERVAAGLARTRIKGTVLGRPKVPNKIEAAVRTARTEGKTYRQIADEVGCSVGTVSRILNETT